MYYYHVYKIYLITNSRLIFIARIHSAFSLLFVLLWLFGDSMITVCVSLASKAGYCVKSSPSVCIFVCLSVQNLKN